MKTKAMRIYRREAGFSLIELMIGVALGLIVLAALTSFYVSTSANRHEIERTSRQIENGRFAIDTLRGELVLAGFYAELQQTGATWVMPDPCLTDLASMGFVLGPPTTLPLPISGYAMDGAMPGCLADKVPGTDAVVVRRFNTEVSPAATPVAAQYYFQPSRCATDSNTTPWVFNGGGSGAFTLRRVDCAGLAPLYRHRVAVFYIRDYSTTPGDKTPTLVKLELDNGVVNTYAMVEGIQDMRFEYGIDTTGDGGPDEYRRCDTTTPCTADQWAGVTAVRAHVLAVNLEPTLGHKDDKEYDMGSGNPRTVGPFGDQFKRHIYAAVITLPNRTGPKE
jgi:type IV pilus assembly protein PilW